MMKGRPMVRHRLTAGWTYDVGPGFRSSVVRGNLRLVGRGRSVTLSAFEREADDATAELARLLAESGAVPNERIDETGAHGELRHAHWAPQSERGRARWVLEGYTVTTTDLVRSSFRFDLADDLAWAIAGWRSIEPRLGSA
jgi:hypothetical protein